MTNVITTEEMLEQYGSVILQFKFYFKRFFIFSGHSFDKKDIMLMVSIDMIFELQPIMELTIDIFEDIIKDKAKNDNLIKVKITDGISNIYQTMEN